jgi:membrane-associated protein
MLETLILTYKYWIILPLAIVEGPIVTIAASFLSSLGLLNIFIVYALALLGDIIGDILHYMAGRFGGRGMIQKYGHFFRITESGVDQVLQKYFNDKNSLWKVITLSKVTHAPSSAVMLASGLAKVDFRQFLLITTINNIFKVLVFVLIGYFFGEFYLIIGTYISNSWVFFLPLFILFAFFLYRKK